MSRLTAFNESHCGHTTVLTLASHPSPSARQQLKLHLQRARSRPASAESAKVEDTRSVAESTDFGPLVAAIFPRPRSRGARDGAIAGHGEHGLRALVAATSVTSLRPLNYRLFPFLPQFVPCMALFLPLDVILHNRHVFFSQRECTVSTLPFKELARCDDMSHKM